MLFVIVGSLVGIGVILSFYGNHMIFEELIKGEGQIKFGENLTIQVELDKIKMQNGIYAIQVLNFREGAVTARIIDPSNIEIKSQMINKESFEDRFDITVPGIYKLIIENSEDEEIQIFGVIGPEPDAGKKSLTFISFYILIVGLIGMVIVTIYVIKNRRKTFS